MLGECSSVAAISAISGEWVIDTRRKARGFCHGNVTETKSEHWTFGFRPRELQFAIAPPPPEEAKGMAGDEVTLA